MQFSVREIFTNKFYLIQPVESSSKNVEVLSIVMVTTYLLRFTTRLP